MSTFPDPRPVREEAARLMLRTDLRLALGAVYDNPGWLEVDALIDQLEDRGLSIVRSAEF